METKLKEYETFLKKEEKSPNTIAKYRRDIKALFAFLKTNQLDKSAILKWKNSLVKDYAPSSINSMLTAVNGFLEWNHMAQHKVKLIKVQREIFAKPEKELTREEYLQLVSAAEAKENQRLALLLQTICATGIRVSELRYITVSAVRTGRASVDCKGKTRTVFLPHSLCKMLSRYCRLQNVNQGIVFCTKNGRAIDRSNIWKEMKALCKSAGVQPGKVFPHNLRHLFARTFYGVEKDLSRLADLLGHSNVSTTRIYTMDSGKEHERQIEQLGLLSIRT